ncbi:hypothetical protein [Spirosoma sp.]|uniref:hypothetical protein n=1 Tax=Spirosoma sp. TaxID=1899569 RepID=UPI003B3A1BEA
MKTLLTTILALTGSLAFAQKHSSINSYINDDEKNLSIRVHGTVDGKSIHYDRSIDVSGMTLDQRNALRERILDSLNIQTPEPPEPPQPVSATIDEPVAPVAPRAPKAPKAPKPPRFDSSESITIVGSDSPTVVATNGSVQTTAVGGEHPFTKEVTYDSDSGKLYLRYRFEKDGEDTTYERTINARGKSQQERQRIIEGVEKEIGLPKSGK